MAKFFNSNGDTSARIVLSVADAEQFGQSEIVVEEGSEAHKAGAEPGRYSCLNTQGEPYMSKDGSVVLYYKSGGVEIPLKLGKKGTKKLF